MKFCDYRYSFRLKNIILGFTSDFPRTVKVIPLSIETKKSWLKIPISNTVNEHVVEEVKKESEKVYYFLVPPEPTHHLHHFLNVESDKVLDEFRMGQNIGLPFVKKLFINLIAFHWFFN